MNRKAMNSNWIWTGDWTADRDEKPTAVLFRRRVVLEAEAAAARIRISADSRYKLYVNGSLAAAGPSKGDSQVWYYDEPDIGRWLVPGENVIAVIVLRFPMKPGKGNQSIIVTHTPGLYFSGEIEEKNGRRNDISADENWKCRIDGDTCFVAEKEGFAPLHIFEEVTASKELWQWKMPEYEERGWKSAVPYPKAVIRESISPGNLIPRTIPPMRREKKRFAHIAAWRKMEEEKRDSWTALIKGAGAVEIPAGTQVIAELDAGEETTGYLHLLMERGAGTAVKLLSAEGYIRPELPRRGDMPFKGDRADSSGVLEGYADYYHTGGFGNEKTAEEYETFWFRTFRFLRVEVTAGREPLIIRDIFFEETGYPLEVKTSVETSDPTLAPVWDISVRTMKRCMQETYTDCPFYEQLQYVMDSRAQILFTYAVSLDDRLARKCMDDFRRSQRYDGLLPSAWPNTRPNVVPGFSIFYILMIHDHMMYFGDKELVKYHMPAVESVLDFFERNRTSRGYVGKIGGFYRQEKFWSFIDWVPQWSVGVPGAAGSGALTMESLLYVLGLQKAAELAAYIGRPELSGEYLGTAGEVTESIRRSCMNQEGWITDGPGVEELSQHCQVFAILTGVLEAEQGRKILRETLERRDKYAQCTVSMAWYLFRAMELTGLYAYTDRCWEVWRQMVDNHMTTVAESDEYPRSDCHAWGALALYELPCAVLGVRPTAPGFAEFEVRPIQGYLTWAKGKIITPRGLLSVKWKMNEGKMEIETSLEAATAENGRQNTCENIG